MGLDMYLTKRSYVYGKEAFPVNQEIKAFDTIVRTERIKYIEEEVCYWRKANAIHKWFVQNVQGGEDNCGRYLVSEDSFRALIETIEKILNTPQKSKRIDLAAIHLPVTSGFFFGSTEYDKYYIEDLQFTLEKFKEILKESEDFPELYYESSW
jgi:hypothetical protein